MAETYYIKIFIEKRGTIHRSEDKKTGKIKESKSTAGHMWFKIYATDEKGEIIDSTQLNAGYTKKGIVNDDEVAYLGNSACESQALEITQEAYGKLVEFAQASFDEDKKEQNLYAKFLGFGVNDYNFISNSCVDYVWKALNIAGYNQAQFEGKLVPMENCKKIQEIVPHTQSTIYNRNHLLNNFEYPNSFLFDFNTDKDINRSSQISQPLSSSPSSSYSFFPPDRINTQRIGTISFDIKALDEITRMPIPHTKIQLENANLGQQSITNSQGLASFTLQETQYLKPFRAKLINEYYKQCPVS